jgi:hypothetical protein
MYPRFVRRSIERAIFELRRKISDTAAAKVRECKDRQTEAA